MHHCVGGYDRECLTGRTQIFSRAHRRGNRLSTLQLSVREGPRGTFRFSAVAAPGRVQCRAAGGGGVRGKAIVAGTE